ncbi:uncharacterized protein LOC34620977 [Cyclospora cayetanensis]|uniref:Uncharacterized protein LOC34620977 n=1 Tax=Cyclospora cayetanensis TaxID=88456 RepID=A0A6P6RV52_9EIME|nr:uncharacterized protein LOC34620977 [Cyclospora cayetanensis]
MEKNDCAENQRWRAIHGKRTEELLRGPAAGLQTDWGHDAKETLWAVVYQSSYQTPCNVCVCQVADRLLGRIDDEVGAVPTSKRLELFQRRNSSTRIQDIINWTDRTQEEPGVLNVSGERGLSLDSANFRSVQSLRRQIAPSGGQYLGSILEHRFANPETSFTDGWKPHSSGKTQSTFPRDQHGMQNIIQHSYVKGDPVGGTQHRLSQVHTTENPCRWGVDVLNYQLPEPRKPRGLVNEESLGTGLIPKWNFDDPLCPRRKTTSVMCQVSCRGHLEPSTLCPTENASQKFAQGKKKSEMQGDSLDQTYTPYKDEGSRSLRKPSIRRPPCHLQGSLVPFDEPEFSRKRCYKQWHMCSLQVSVMSWRLNPASFQPRSSNAPSTWITTELPTKRLTDAALKSEQRGGCSKARGGKESISTRNEGIDGPFSGANFVEHSSHRSADTGGQRHRYAQA